MADMNVRIDFSTNASEIKRKVDALAHSTDELAKVSRLQLALENNKASAKALTGQIRGRQAILKLESQINAVAQRRLKMLYKQYNFGDQDRYVKGLMHQNEVLRIQRKILDDNATAMVNLGKNTQWAGRQLVVGFTVPLTIAAGAAMKAFSDLEKELVKFKRVYGDAFTTNEELAMATKQVEKLAVAWTKYGVSVADTIELAAEAAGAGFSGQQLTAQIEAANKLAVLGELDKQKAMKATIAVQSTFQQSNMELGQTINFLNQLENQTMVTMDDMTTAIPKAATVVKGLGGTIQDLGVFMAAMAEGGVTAAEGANALKSGLGSLLNPSKKAKEELDKIGVSMDTLWANSESNGRGVIYVIEQLSEAMDSLGQTQRQALIEEMFGKHQFARINALLSNINRGTQALEAKSVAGTSQLEAAMIAQQELGKLGESNLTKFQEAIEKLKASIAPLGETIMGFVTPIVNFVTKMINKFDAMPDMFQKMVLGITALAGVAAPLFLMLLGQVQNMLGNGMKFVNWMRNWGKNTKWVTGENITLADTLSRVDAQLIAENRLLQQNTALWNARTAAATGAAVVGGTTRKFATGGTVPGSGNSDTVPAMLTPGEFVVRKSIAQKFGGMLSALNSGKIRGYSRGGSVQAHMTMPTPLGQWDNGFSGLSSSGMSGVGSLFEAAKAIGVSVDAMANVVSNFTRTMSHKMNQDLKYGVEKERLAAEFTGKYGKLNMPMGRSMALGGASESYMLSDKALEQHRTFDKIMAERILSLKKATVTDEDLSAATRQTIQQMKNMGGESAEFAALLDNASRQVGQVRPAQVTANARAAMAAGIDPSGFARVSSTSGKIRPKNIEPSVNYRRFSWRMLRRNRGGNVPGTGNTDSVPALLTPGESVINKEATKRFGPLLEAINSGRLGMFNDGFIGVGKDYGSGMRGNALSIEDRQGLMRAFTDSINAIVDDMRAVFQMTEQQADELRQRLESEYARDQGTGEASHKYRSVDPVTGQKMWSHENLAFTPKIENNAFEQMTKSTNLKALDESFMAMAKTNKFTVQQLQQRADIIARLTQGEHMMEEAERKLLAEMILESEQYAMNNPGATRLTESVRDPALIGGLRGVVPNAATGGRWTAAHTATALPHKSLADTTKNIENLGDTAGKTNDSMTGFSKQQKMMTSMFAIQAIGMTGMFDKMGKFGEAVTAATTALMTMSMLGLDMKIPGIGKMKGLGGKLAGGKLAGLGGKAFSAIKGGAGAGLAVGLAGNIIGGLIADQQGGARDVAGKMTKYAGIGGGLGMLFGPLGAGIGAAAGALVGFAVQVKANREALEKLEIAASSGADSWNKIADQLQEEFNLGTNKSFADALSAAGGLNADQQELYQRFSETMNENSEMMRRINTLVEAQQKGVLAPGQVLAEIQGLALQLRGRGVDEESISAITAAFVDRMPEAVRQGVDASSIARNGLGSTTDIINGIGRATYGQAGGLIVSGLTSIDQQIANLDVTSEDYSDKLQELLKQQDMLNEKHQQRLDNLYKEGLLTDDVNAYYRSLSSTAEGLISSGSGQGLRNGQADQAVMGAVSGMEDDVAQAMVVLMEAGVNLNWAADLIAKGGQSVQEAGLRMVQLSDNIKAQARLANIVNTLEGDSERLAKGIKDFEDATADRNKKLADAFKEYNLGGSTFSAASISEKKVSQAKIDTELEVRRIKIEQAAVKSFAAKFNRMFNQNIDSFADASFIIDNIGRQISAIQRNQIQPLQDRIERMNRANEMDSRKIDKLQKKQQEWDDEHKKRIDKINEAYDAQADALERVRKQNEYIAQQQQANIALASALSSGDLAGAAGAMVAAAQNQAQYASTLNEQALGSGRDAAIARVEAEKNPYDAKIEAIQARMEKRARSIQKIEDKIYNINKNQIEPLERRQELMQATLAEAQALSEQQQANADGYDAENRAREAALTAAQEATIEAQKQKTLEQDIRKEYRGKLKDIAKTNELQFKGAKDLQSVLKENKKTTDEQLAVAKDGWDALRADYDAILQGKPQAGSAMDYIAKIYDYLEGNGDIPKRKTDKTPAPGTSGGKPLPLATGGNVPGTGGRDSVPAVLTPGEYVMRKSTVDRIGTNVLDRINHGDPGTNPWMYTGGASKFAAGGSVGKPQFLGTFGNKFASNVSGLAPFSSGYGDSVGGTSNNAASAGDFYKALGRGPEAVASAFENLIGSTTIMGESVYRRCAANVGKIWRKYIGTPFVAGEPSAYSAAKKIRSAGMMRSGYNAPRGSVYFWDNSIGGGYGHVAVADGRGNAINNWGGRAIERHNARSMADKAYMGYSLRFNSGGLVPGAGISDTIPAMLTPGEFVLNKDAVRSIGMGPLRELNSRGLRESAMPRSREYASGGDMVYNTFDMSFTIHEASDADMVAETIMRKFDRATRSSVRSR